MEKHIVGKNGRTFSGFSLQGLGNTLWSFVKQAQLSLEVIEILGDSVKLVSTGRLAVHETSCLGNGEDFIKRLLVRAAEAGIAHKSGSFQRSMGVFNIRLATYGVLQADGEGGCVLVETKKQEIPGSRNCEYLVVLCHVECSAGTNNCGCSFVLCNL